MVGNSVWPVNRVDLISVGTRNAFRALATNIPQNTVASFWEDEGFVAVDQLDYDDSSVRRVTFQTYAAAVDWTDINHVQRALRAFEWELKWLARNAYHNDSDFDGVWERLDRDGLALDANHNITWKHPKGLEHSLASLNDASGIRDEIDRAHQTLLTDPAGAIGASKQLIEATAKYVLTELGVPLGKNPDLPDLVKSAQQALHLHPSTVNGIGPDGAGGLRKILGSVSTIAIGLAELRNLGYGTGHGHAKSPVGLGVRHARLAVNAATTWCQLLLDTLADPKAPWRNAAATSSSSTTQPQPQIQSPDNAHSTHAAAQGDSL